LETLHAQAKECADDVERIRRRNGETFTDFVAVEVGNRRADSERSVTPQGQVAAPAQEVELP
jgi:hypothetical protein